MLSLEKIRFENNRGETFSTGSDGIYANQSDLRDYDWQYSVNNNKIGSFTMDAKEKTIPIRLAVPPGESTMSIRDRIIDITSQDIDDEKPGRFIVGDYYLECFVVGVSYGRYLRERYCEFDLKIATDSPRWIKEQKKTFMKENIYDETGIDFPFDFPFDFSVSNIMRRINNDSRSSADFMMMIYGPCVRPVITIGETMYDVNVVLGEGELLQIDARKKTITKIGTTGTRTNVYSKWVKESGYIFQPIPAGETNVNWNDDFGFDITLYQRRSTPPWS